MKKNSILLFILILFTISCGGNEASFYTFTFNNIHRDFFLNSLDSVLKNNPKYEYIYADSVLKRSYENHYPLEKYCYILLDDTVYRYNFKLYDSLSCCGNVTRGECVKLAIFTANLKDSILSFSKDISDDRKQFYIKLFKDSFINKLKLYLPKDIEICEIDY